MKRSEQIRCVYIGCTLIIAVQRGIKLVHSVNVHYDFGHHYKWLSPQIMPYLRV